MSSRSKRIILVLLAAALFTGVSFVQNSLNYDRQRLGLTHAEPLENAPPVLAFTTVALGGFRGLISNALWIRAMKLQDDDKFFEMQQLADWITKLEPHFSQVWVNQAWNMAYNISVKFKENAPGDFSDRWRWVKAGIELLRDEGLKYNPNDVLIFRELAWIFQHKIGANLDDGNMYYKWQWAREMTNVFGGDKPNYDELINPKTEDEKKHAQLLREKYKMDPKFMKQVDERYGPLEWRLPEAHAIYWSAMGLERASESPGKVKKDDLIQLRRGIYQDMQTSFYRGKLVRDPFAGGFEFGPNLDIFPKVYAAYIEMRDETSDSGQKDNISRALRNLVKEAVYYFYVHDRIPEANKWYQVLAKDYPDNNLIVGDPNSFPRNLTMEDFAVARAKEEAGDTSRDGTKNLIEGFIVRAYRDLILGQDDTAAGYVLLAQQVLDKYNKELDKASKERIGLPPFEELKKEVLDAMLDSKEGLPYEARVILRRKLNLKPEPPPTVSTNVQTVSTNAPPVSTNATGVQSQ
jgi:hypothetical protein